LALLNLIRSVINETVVFIFPFWFKPLKVFGTHNDPIISGRLTASSENDEIGSVLSRGNFPLVKVNSLDWVFNENLPVIECEWVRAHSNRMFL
jgi:hypothetical protein